MDSDYTGTFAIDWYTDTFKDIDASAVTGSIQIEADEEDNLIYAGKGGGNIYAGDGEDTIYCGKGGGLVYAGEGDDTIYFSSGNDTLRYNELDGEETVYNYRDGDAIYLGTEGKEQFKNFSVDGEDVIINLTQNGKITLKDAREQSIYIYDWNVYGSAFNVYNSTFGNISTSGTSVTLNSGYTGTFNVSWYAESFKDIDASAVIASIEIHGDDQANVIHACRAGGNIYAGKGDDTIYFGYGNDTIRFYKYDGNETVYNIGDNDAVVLNDCTAEDVSVNGSDVVITTSSEETITLKDGTGKRIFITGQDWQTYTASEESNGNAAVPWFAEDDTNFTTADLDSLIETPIANSAGALSLGGGDFNTLADFKTELTCTGEK